MSNDHLRRSGTPRSSAASPPTSCCATAIIAEVTARRRRRRPTARSRSTPTGLVALPGLVDLHTHLREPGREDAETVETGSRAAAAGGFTAVFAMANTDPVADTAGIVEQVWRLGPRGRLRRRAAGRRRHRRPRRASSSPSSARWPTQRGPGAGVLRRRPVRRTTPCIMRRALEYVKAFDGVVAQHAQEPRLTEDAQMNEGALSGVLGLRGWPAVAEEAIIARDVLLAEHVGSRLHVCHVSTAGSVEIIRWAKARGVDVTAEVTPHHLLLTEELVRVLRPGLQGQPAAAHRGRRRGAARGARRRHDRRRRHRPRPAPGRGQGLRVERRRDRACSGSRPRSASSPRRWSTPGCSTGPASPTGCPCAPARIGRPRGPRPAASRSASRPTSCCVDPTRAAHGRRGRAAEPQPQHAVRRSDPARVGRGDVPARSRRPCSTVPWSAARRSAHDGGHRRRARGARARGRPHLPRPGLRRRRRDVRRGGLRHRHDRLPGDAHRPVLPPAGRGADRAAHRQQRRQRRRRRVARASGSPATSCATRPASRRTGARSAPSTTTCVEQGVVGISDIDTRAITRHLRERGAMRVGVFSGESAADRSPTLLDRVLREPADARRRPGRRGQRSTSRYVVPAVGERRFTVAAVDLGIKATTPQHMAERGIEVHVLPVDDDARAAARGRRRRRVLQQRPRATRRTADHAVALVARGARRAPPAVRDLLRQPGARPRARVRHLQAALRPPRASTSRCMDRATGKVEITAQNHGFAVDAPLDRVSDDAVRPRRGQPRLPQRRRRGGAALPRRAGVLGAVPPRGGRRPARRRVPVRPVLRPDGGRPCPGVRICAPCW